MNARAIPRSAVDTFLKLVRLPLDGAISLLPGNGTGAKPAARLALDRLDARLRAVLSSMLSDPVLHEDPEQRRGAAEQREYGCGFAWRPSARPSRPTLGSRSVSKWRPGSASGPTNSQELAVRRQHARRSRTSVVPGRPRANAWTRAAGPPSARTRFATTAQPNGRPTSRRRCYGAVRLRALLIR